MEHALNAGAGLVKVKEQLGHGEFLPWLAENFEGSERSAQRYMKVARELPAYLENKSDTVSDLSLRRALAEITAPRKEEDIKETDSKPAFITEVAAGPLENLEIGNLEVGNLDTTDSSARNLGDRSGAIEILQNDPKGAQELAKLNAKLHTEETH